MSRTMTVQIRRAPALALALGLALATRLPAQELPDAESIIDRYVEAIGGADAIKSQPAQRAVGRIEVPAQGLSGDLLVLSAPPDRFLLTIQLAGIGEIRSGYDGETAWTIHPAMGPMILDGRMRDQMRQQADMMSPLHPPEFIASVETVERTEFEGCDCYKVRVMTTWDEEYFEFFNVETGLLEGSIRQQATPMGDIEATTVHGDYRQVGDVMMPTRTVQRVMNMEQVLTFSEIESAELADSAFGLPPEIEALKEPAEAKGGY